MDVLTIPGVETVHPRSVWVPDDIPLTGPPALWDEIWLPVAHYPGVDEVPDGDIHEHQDHVPRFLASIHRSWQRDRGYGFGYWFAVDWLGGAWQGRGWDLRSAANPGRKGNPLQLSQLNANRWTVPILFIVDLDKRITPEAAATGRAIWREANRRARREMRNRPAPHEELDWTGCPGRVHEDLADGLLDLDHDPHTTTTEASDMYRLDYRRADAASYHWVRVAIAGGRITWIRGHASAVVDRLAPPGEDVSRAELIDLMRSLGTTGPSPWDASQEGSARLDAELHGIWEATAR